MGLLSRFSDAIRTRNVRRDVAYQEVTNHIRINPLCSNYENVFAQVRPLVNEMKMVRPYGIGAQGARKDKAQTPALAALDYPNEEMGWAEFADLMFATWLTEEELNVHVWRNGRKKIFGYTVLPVGCRIPDLENGGYKYVFTNSQNKLETLYDDEVITLRFSRSPKNPDKGVSPATSVEIYAQIDDVVAQFQKAWFENGAVPAQIAFVKARDRDSFNKKKNDLERGLHGARNKNKTLFLWRQYLNDGSTADEVEYKTIQGNNSTQAIKEVIEIVHGELNKAFGVSEFILGNDSSAKYDNAELSRQQFLLSRVYPALLSFWDQFQHELDRITGGLGYAITFDLDIPELTDRLKTKAEIAKTTSETMEGLIKAGAMPSAVVEALNLSKKWLSVADGLYAEKLRQDELATTMPQLPMYYKKELPEGAETTEDEAKKHTCNHTHKTTEDALYVPVFAQNEQDEQKIYDQLMSIAEAIADENDIPVEEAEQIINDILMKQADAGANKGAGVISGQLAGSEIGKEIVSQLKGDGYHLSEDFTKRLEARTDALVQGFATHTKERVQMALRAPENAELGASELKKVLSEVLPRGRAQMIARNETVYAFRAGRLENDEHLAQKYGIQIRKVWKTSKDGDVCPVCAAMEGTTVELRDAFPDHAESKDGTFYWEQSSWNNGGEIPDAHVNCRCYFDEEIV